jgi:hypothetical protein
VAAASFTVVFSVNLSGITGIVPIVINEKIGSMRKIDQEEQESEKTVSGNRQMYGILRQGTPDKKLSVED